VRGKAVGETRAVLDAAQVVPYRYLVVHLDGPGPDTGAVASSFDAVRRSLDELYPLAVSRGVALAFEVLGTPISSPDALVRTIDQLELDAAGVCLDVGHAHAAGGVIDAVETVSGSLWTTHIHDSSATGGRHLVPFAGVIDWSGALLSLQKVGYEGPYIMELEGGSDPLEVLRRAASARRRLEAILAS
jgi:sugar phosphate isomerase/epimerase